MRTITEPSVKSLLIKMQFNGQLLATGTGFLAPSRIGPVLVTNRHNVTGRNPITNECLHDSGGVPNEIVIVHNRKGKLGSWIEKKEQIIDAGGNPVWYVHPELRERADFVAIKLAALDDVELFTYDPSNPGPSIVISPAESISVVGFPFGKTAGGSFAIWATGFMASEPSIDYDDLPIFLIDCRSRQGQSGSPVIAYRNGGMHTMANRDIVADGGNVIRFLGIYSGRINAESDLGIVWKASAILEMLNDI
jgi:hypothetical protein